MKQFKETIENCLNEEEKELFVYEYIKQNENSIYEILTNLSNIWKTLTTPRHTKIIINILKNNKILKEENILELLNKIINWSKSSNKKNLTLELIIFKTNTLYLMNRFTETLQNIDELIIEFKKIDERRKLADIYILKSQTLYSMGSFQKSRSILSASRGISLSTICPNRVVAMIDLLSGVFLCDDGDYNGACSYFMEAVTGFKKNYNLLEITFCYIILSKIVINDFSGIQRIINSKDFKLILKDNRNEKIDILIELAESVKLIQLGKFDEIIKKLNLKLFDKFMQKHLEILYHKLFDKALTKLIKPYEVIYLKFISEKLNISEKTAYEKLHEMILNNEINGTLNFEKGILKLHLNKKGLINFKEELELLEEINLIK